MPRIRTIKPEFWDSPGNVGLDPWARLLFIAMWNWADDHGRGTADPKPLAAFAFPHDEWIGLVEIRRALVGIHRGFDVIFYKVRERPYYYIPSWERHQKIDRRSTPKYPGPEEGEEYDPGADDLGKVCDSWVSAEPSMNSHESPPSPRCNSGVGTGEQGNRGEVQLPVASALMINSRAEPEVLAPLAALAPLDADEGVDTVSTMDKDLNAGQLVREWIDYCNANSVVIPPTTIKRYGAGIKKALNGRVSGSLIRTALGEMFRDRVVSRPALLDNYILRVQQGPEFPPRRMGHVEAGLLRMDEDPAALFLRTMMNGAS